MKKILVFVVCLFSLQLFAQQSKPLVFREESYDFGVVKEFQGAVTHEFTFTNVVNRPVKILSVEASCGCTTPDWSREPVAPGKTGFIQARFDPKGRPGYFSKSLTVTTNFDSNPIVLQIKGHVSDGAEESDYPIEKGNLRFKTSSFNLGKVYLKDEFAGKEFEVFNAGEKPVYVMNTIGPAYIQVDVNPDTIKAGESATVRVLYNGLEKGQYGFHSDNVEIHTNDDVSPIKSFSVYATLEDYFPPMSPEELSKAPKLKLVNTALDFGRIKQNTTTVREYSFVNTGKSDLKIKALQPNCTCVTAETPEETIKPGQTGSILVSFNPADRKGAQMKAVTIYSNDPQNPVQRITFNAYVED